MKCFAFSLERNGFEEMTVSFYGCFLGGMQS